MLTDADLDAIDKAARTPRLLRTPDDAGQYATAQAGTIVRLIAEVRRLRADLTAARRDAATCRAVAGEMARVIEMESAPNFPGAAVAEQYRARLASPDPGPAVEAVGLLDSAAYQCGWDARESVPDDGGPPYPADEENVKARNAARADVLRLLGVSEVDRG